MRYLLFISLFLAGLLASAQKIDRKIIIENGLASYVSIDQLFQIGTLHQSSLDDTLQTGMALALPAGRTLGGNDNPLAWDVDGNTVYAISFLDHPLNDRYEAIKKFSRDSLKGWSSFKHPGEVILQSVDNYTYLPNEPYKNIAQTHRNLDTYYHDAIYHDNKFWMVVTCSDEWIVWNFDMDSWSQSIVQKPRTSCAFTLFADDEGVKMISQNSAIYQIKENKIELIQEAKIGIDLKNGVIIENRDSKSISFLATTHLDKQHNFEEILKEFGTLIYQ